MKYVIFVLFICFLGGISVQAETLVGTATNEDGQVVYMEEHTIERDDGGLTKRVETNYYGPDRNKIAKMISNFGEKVASPDSKFEDFRFDRVFEGRILKKDNKVIYEIQEYKSGKLVKLTDLEYKDDLVSGPGFDNYIKQNFIKAKAERKSVLFLVLPRHDYYSFEVLAKGSRSGAATQEYVIKPSLVLSLFVKEIKIFYDAKTGLLKKYEGLSNLPSSKDSPQSVTIDYQISNGVRPGAK